MASLLGWKDILRPIRDGYRHLFPTPDTGPTPEERRLQRERDRLKGFTYFDTFVQLEYWNASDSDPLQRSNTPLLPRCDNAPSQQESKASILLVHDYAGNYHDYESMQEADLAEEMYSCEYLQYVESFAYFSHKLVCIPPPTWANNLHRNGVKALGTILLEPQTKETERLLQYTGDDSNMKFSLATTLANIAKHYGFDGYLVNIEVSFPREAWSPTILQAFLVQLREELGDDKQLVWYDALTISNNVFYQNGLTASNLLFAEACGSILTNYSWGDFEASKSRTVALQAGFPLERLFFGVDVWAQNSTVSHRSRTTYPKKGGGGTNTGIAITKLAELGMSAGIFAPAWSFEHFPGQGTGTERVMWEGKAMPKEMKCDCPSSTTQHQQIPGHCIVRSAKKYPAGTETFFSTDFSRAFATNIADGSFRAQLGTQSPLPLPLQHMDRGSQGWITHRVENLPQNKLVVEAHDCTSANTPIQHFDRWVPLFDLHMPANNSLRVIVFCRNLLKAEEGAVAGLYLNFSDQQRPQLLSIENTEDLCTIHTMFGTHPHSHTDKSVRLEELGVHMSGSSGEGTVPILEIYSISILPFKGDETPQTRSIHDIDVEHRGQGENENVRLCWKYTDSAEARPVGLPYSGLTGPFSHFHVRINEIQIGRAYALECIVSKELVETFADKEVNVEVTGMGFDGKHLARHSAIVSMGMR